MRIKTGDNVIVITGKNKGAKGKVLEVLRDKDRVVVEGVNVVKRHMKGKGGVAGSIVEKTLSVHASNVMLVDPTKGTQTRIEKKVVGDRLVRVAKKSNSQLAK
ncbi:MAG: 50S ribosomal protein L24 [bacterium]